MRTFRFLARLALSVEMKNEIYNLGLGKTNTATLVAVPTLISDTRRWNRLADRPTMSLILAAAFSANT